MKGKGKRKQVKQVRRTKAELIQQHIDLLGLDWTVSTSGMGIMINRHANPLQHIRELS
jgi:hypothetical protein|tara:strand:- start:97 stop:270 length:174 start_codon:yes stop_codon:yes gene_type:complete